MKNLKNTDLIFKGKIVFILFVATVVSYFFAFRVASDPPAFLLGFLRTVIFLGVFVIYLSFFLVKFLSSFKNSQRTNLGNDKSIKQNFDMHKIDTTKGHDLTGLFVIFLTVSVVVILVFLILLYAFSCL